jgi:hypothetical protein
MNIHIRDARREDAPFLARSILIAGRAHVKKGIWEVILGLSEEQCLQFLQNIAITGPPHLFHYSCYYIAETAVNTPTGSLGGYDPKLMGYQALQQAIPAVYSKLKLPKRYHAKPMNVLPGSWPVSQKELIMPGSLTALPPCPNTAAEA